MMQYKIPQAIDAVITAVTTATTGATYALLAQVPWEDPKYYQELRMLLLPLIGAMIASGGMVMLNPHPQPETRKIIIGRAVFALFSGALAPQLIGYAHPALQSLMMRPVMMLAMGGLVAMVCFAVSKPFCRGLYERAERIAKKTQDAMEEALEAKIRAVTTERHTITIEDTKPLPNKLPDNKG